jgi:hypothetical protein
MNHGRFCKGNAKRVREAVFAYVVGRGVDTDRSRSG